MHWQLLPVPGRRAAQLAPPAARRQVVIVVANDGEPQGYVRRTLELPGGCNKIFAATIGLRFRKVFIRDRRTPRRTADSSDSRYDRWSWGS